MARVALVTGGTRGIGAEISRALKAQGRTVVAIYHGNDVAAQAHAMVGMAAGYGMAALEARLRALMQAARGSDIGRVAALAVELDAELSMAANALRDALAIEIV